MTSNITRGEMTPEELLEEFDAGSRGLSDVDMRSVLWAIIDDIRDTYRRAMQARGIPPSVETEVDDYIANHYTT